MGNILTRLGIQPAVRKALSVRDKAMSGDIVMSISPTTVNRAPTAVAFTRNVQISIETAAGLVHDWLNDTFTTTASIGDTSSAGTASIDSTTLTIVNGQAIIDVDGDAAAWLGGTAQIRTITCTAGESTGAGDITMTVTAAGMSNSPKDVVVAIGAEDDTVTKVGDLVRAALALDADVSSFFTVSGTAGAVVLTAITPAGDDATLDNTFVDTDSTGVTFGASVDTTPGVAKETDTLTIANITVLGVTVTGGTSIETISD